MGGRMKLSKIVILLVALTIAITGLYCKKSSPTESTGQLDGVWEANNALEETKIEYDATPDFPVPLDGILLGSWLKITVNGDRYSLEIFDPQAEEVIPDAGKFGVSGNTITMTSDDPEEGVLVFSYTRNSDDLMTLVTEGIPFPLNDQITAKLTLVLKRTGN